MAEDQCSIYYSSQSNFNLDAIYNFLKQEGVIIDDPQTKMITACDLEVDRYEINFCSVKQKIANQQGVNLLIKLNSSIPNVFWTIRLQDGCWVNDFYFSYLDYKETKIFSKILLKFFTEILLVENNCLGMFIDAGGRTYDFDFDPFFIHNEGEIDYITELICVRKDKLNKILINSNHTVRELNNDFVCVTSNKEFLDFIFPQNDTP